MRPRKYIAGDLVIPEMLVWALRGLAQRDRDQDAGSAIDMVPQAGGVT